MSASTDRPRLDLEGPGGSYLRVSGDRQEFQRQVDGIDAFLRRHQVTIPPQHRYEDHGLPRDLSAKRPDFQRMMKAVEAGALRWIVVDTIERFGFRDEWEFAEMLLRLRRAGCRLIDCSGDDWTADGMLSFFKAGLAGHASRDKQVKTSHQALGGMVARARAGEWQGAPPKLGFDVGCFDRQTGEELWRVIWEGRDKVGTVERRGKRRPAYHIRRLKVYPDGRTERFDGNVVFRTSKETQVMRIVPTRDEARLSAARKLFERYATEAVNFFDLAKWLNELGIRNSFGNKFQSRDVIMILGDEAYLGYPTFSKRRTGRFNRVDNGEVREVEPELSGKDTESTPEDVIRSGVRLFAPVVDRKIWDLVRGKLRLRTKTQRAPKDARMYLRGLVVCGGCGKPMIPRTDRGEYFCATWNTHRVQWDIPNSPCLRNGVRQDVLEEYLNRYLEETGKRLDLLTEGLKASASGDPGPLAGKLEEQVGEAARGLAESFARMMKYLGQHHPESFDYLARQAMEDEDRRREAFERGEAPVTPLDYIEAAVVEYDFVADPAVLNEELGRLNAEHTRLVEGWADLPTPLAKEKARARLAALEARIEELRAQRKDLGTIVTRYYDEMRDLRRAVEEARTALTSDEGPAALRQRAEAVRSVLVEIRCEFVVTGKKGRGPGMAGARLVALVFNPIVGDGKTISVDDPDGSQDSRGPGGSKGKRGRTILWEGIRTYSPFIPLLRIRYVV